MIKRLENNEVGKVLWFLEKHFSDCIFLYMDLKKYGVNHPDVSFWYSEKNGGPHTVLMKYYDSFQVYSSECDWQPEEYAELISKFHVSTINGNEEVIRKLDKCLKGYKTAYGVIVQEKRYKEFPQFSLITKANPEESCEIAQLMCSDKEFQENYTVENLAKQLGDRMKENAGRSYVLREDGKIVAHVGTFIEDERIVVESGLIVDEAYRNKFYGLIIHEYLKKIIMEERKKVYAFRIRDNMQRYTKAGNDDICGYYGKMTRSEENV